MFCRVVIGSQRLFFAKCRVPSAAPAVTFRHYSSASTGSVNQQQGSVKREGAPSKGTLHYQNGKTYKGDVLDGKRHGNGILTFPEGKSFTGVFNQDRLVSGSGTYIWANNTVSTGSWEQGKMQGPGKTVDASGNITEGEFRNGKMHTGKLLTLTRAGHVHTGSWTDGKFTKLSTDISVKDLIADESKKLTVINKRFGNGEYSGETMFGKRHGKGKFTCKQYTYTGQWVHNQRYGEGQVYFADNTSYRGDWSADAYHGKGTLHNADGTTLAGEFRNGRIYNGTGKLIVQSSQEKQWRYTFEGTWVDGKMQGQGTKTLDNYYVYVGSFKDGAMHGMGFLREITGEEWRGEFRRNEVYRGEGSLVRPDGTVLHGKWEHGKHVEASEE